jgi:hypothetical protein
MTSARTRAQGRERGLRHRRLRRRGKAVFEIRPHVERLSEALVLAGMPREETKNHAKVEAALDGLVREWVLTKLRGK